MPYGGARSRARIRKAGALVTAAMLSGVLLAPGLAHAATGAKQNAALTHTATTQPALTSAQALALARTSGKSVQATAETTSTSTLTANPDGTLTLAQSTTPLRKRIGGAWKNLDATLARNPDGSISPKVAISPLALSGGGNGPLATMHCGLGALALSLPPAFTLTAPALSGATATYRDVLPGVDLAATAQDTGGFSEVLIVHDATAAANPALASLALSATATGLTLRTDAAGNLTATDNTGRAVITAPAPRMWDSATPTGAVPTAVDPSTGQTLDAATGNPLASSALTPGAGAHIKPLKTAYTAGRITLTPDASLLTGSNTTYPLYIDPTFTPSGQSDTQQAWAYVSSEYSGQAYWNPQAGGSIGPLHVGYIDDTQDYPNYISTDRSFIRTGIGSGVWGAQVISSSIAFHENWSYSCTASEVDLWQTGVISNATTWQNQPQWLTQLGSKSVAHGHDSSCGPADVPFTITGLMQSAADGKWSNITFGLRASATDENNHNQNSWKQFSNTAVITTTYDHAPNTPTDLTTSPVTSCPATAADATTVGKGDVTLRATVSDPDGTISPLTAQFTLTNTATGATYPQNIDATSGTVAQATYSHTDTSGPFQALSAKTEFSWNLTVTDQDLTSLASATCYFSYDPTAPGAPGLTPINTPTSYCPDLAATDANPSADNLCTIGTAAGFTLTDTNTTTGTPTSYLYQLNDAAPGSVPAGTDSQYTATISLKPTRQTNTLTVTALSPGGNIGGAYTYQFLANAPATATSEDMTGDSHADLLAVGGQNSLPPGLWLASGNGDGTLNPAAVNIGINGNGMGTTATPGSFTGTQIITGHFHTGKGFNDILDYSDNPTAETVNAEILFGQGDGSPIDPVETIPVQNAFSVFTLAGNNTTYYATSLANGGDLYNNANGNPDTGYPDLLLLVNGILYDEPSYDLAGNYGSGGLANDGVPLAGYNPYCLAQNEANANTNCTTDWTGWTITSTLTGTPGLPALFARDTSTSSTDPSAGQLWYLTPTMLNTLIYDDLSNSAADTALAGIQVAGTGWDAASQPSIQAADINGDKTPDLWTLNSTGQPTAQIMTLTGTTAALTPKTDPVLQTADHTWPLSDYNGSTAADYATTGALNLTGTGGVTTHGGDQFNPDAQFDGATGYLATTSAAVTPNADFTLCAWVKPTATGGTVLSQDGTNDSAFTVSLTPGGQWQIAMNNNATTTASYDTDAGTTATLGAWTQLTLNYTAASKTLALYTDNTLSAALTATAPPTATGPLRLGANQTGGAPTGFYTGQIANVQTWNSVLTPPINAAPGTLGDITGDGKPDLLAIDSSGDLWLYPNTGGTGTGTFGTRTKVGTGWSGFTLDAVAHLYPTDPTDRAGLLATDPSGILYYYPNTGGTGLSTFAAPDEVGTGWSPMTVLGLTDLFSAGSLGVLAINTTDHNLYYYPNTGGTGLNTFAAPDEVGTGWIGLTAVVGPVNNDTKPDILALDTSGNLWLYPNTGGTGAPGSPDPTFAAQTQVGTGLTGDQLIALSDPYSTGRNGYISEDTANGNLYYTPNTGGTGLNTFGTPTLIGTAWNGYTIN